MEDSSIINKSLFVLGGPNGAGKSTASKKFFKYFPDLKDVYINPDLIQQESGCGPRVAGRQAIEKAKNLMIRGEPTVMCETTLAGKIPYLQMAREYGYKIILLFIMLDSVKQGKEHVSERKEKGGHFVEETDQERHFYYGLLNLGTVPLECDEWRIYRNANGAYKLIAKGQGSNIGDIRDKEQFAKLAGMRADVLENRLPSLIKSKSVQERWLSSPHIFASIPTIASGR